MLKPPADGFSRAATTTPPIPLLGAPAKPASATPRPPATPQRPGPPASSPPAPCELWTVRHAARHLAITPKRVYQLIADGHVDAVKLGERSTRVTRASVERFVANAVARAREELGLDIRPAQTPFGRQRAS